MIGMGHQRPPAIQRCTSVRPLLLASSTKNHQTRRCLPVRVAAVETRCRAVLLAILFKGWQSAKHPPRPALQSLSNVSPGRLPFRLLELTMPMAG